MKMQVKLGSESLLHFPQWGGLRAGCRVLLAGLVGWVAVAAVAADRLPVGAAPAPSGEGAEAIAIQSGAFLPVGTVAGNLSQIRAGGSGVGGTHVYLQFVQIPDRARQEKLEALGVRLLGYVTSRTYFAFVPDSVTESQLQAAGVRWCGRIAAEDKLPARIRNEGVGAWARRADGSLDLNVKYFADVPVAAAAQTLQSLGAVVLSVAEPLHRLTVNVPPDRLDPIANSDVVRWIEEVPPPPVPHNDGSRINTQAEALEQVPYSLSGDGVVLGIWDGGSVDAAHDDFDGRLVLAETNTVDQHATHVAGTMAGSGILSASRGGFSLQWRGMAPAADIVSYDFDGDTIAEHNPAVNTYGIMLSQNSWGFLISQALLNNCSLYGDYSTLAPEYDQIVTGLFGRPISVIFSAGNERNDGDCGLVNGAPHFLNYRCLGPPATAKNILSIGAINSDDNSMTAFSSWGPTDDGRIKPDLVAPGAQVGGDQGITSTVPGDNYGVLVGTSMASPAVSGCLALLIEDYRALYNDEDPLPSTLKALLIHTAEDLADGGGFLNPGPDYASGYGRLQARAAVDQLRANGFLVGEVGHSQTNLYRLSVPPGTSEVKFTLVWDDPAGAENAIVALVNDLDLVVFDPASERRYPWTLDPTNPSAPAVRTTEDRRNVVEQVFADDGVLAGVWTVQVVGHNVPVGPLQKYTLVVTPATAAQFAQLAVAGTVVDDTVGGDGDGFINAGETISLQVTLERMDELPDTLANVSAVLQTTTAGVTIQQANSAYPDLPAGASANNLTPFVFTVSSNVSCGSQIRFSLVVSSDQGVLSIPFQLDVGSSTSLFLVDFESGLGGIVVDNTGNGLWHLSSGRGKQPGHSRTNSLYFGQGETPSGGGNYHTGAPARGHFTTPPISLVGHGSQVLLTFNHLLRRENVAPGSYDVAKIEASTDGGRTFVLAGGPFPGTAAAFERATVNLSRFVNQTILLRFSFDTVDAQANEYEGWYVDDIQVRAFRCGAVTGAAGQIVTQGTTATNATAAVFTVFEARTGGGTLSQPVLTAAPHSDFRFLPVDTEGDGVQAVVVAGRRNNGIIDFEVRHGRSGDEISSGSLPTSLTTPYQMAVADVDGGAGEELIFVASSASGPVLEVRYPRTAALLQSYPVLDGSAYVGFEILTGDINGNGMADVVVIGRRADGSFVVDGGTIREAATLHGVAMADLLGAGRQQLVLLGAGKKGPVVGAWDVLSGRKLFAKRALKGVSANQTLLTGRMRESGTQVVVVGTLPDGRLAGEVLNQRGRRIGGFVLPSHLLGLNAAAAGDLDGDGRVELALATTRATNGRAVLLVLDATTGGSLYWHELFGGVPVQNLQLFTADVDGDGGADVVVSATRQADSRVLFEVRAGSSGQLFSAFDQGTNFAGPTKAFGANVGE